MSRDVLFLLEPGFADPKHPGQRFVCPHGLSIEGLLASAPDRASRIDVKRVGFERPRHAVIDALDDAHQGLPVLVLGRDQPAPDDAQRSATCASSPTRAASSNCWPNATDFRCCIDAALFTSV